MKKKVIKKKPNSFRCMACDKLCKTKEKWLEISKVKSAVCGPCEKSIDLKKSRKKPARKKVGLAGIDEAIELAEIFISLAETHPKLFMQLLEIQSESNKK